VGAPQAFPNINKIEHVYDVPTRYREVVLTVSKQHPNFEAKPSQANKRQSGYEASVQIANYVRQSFRLKLR